MKIHPDSRRESSERLVVWKADGEPCRVVCSTGVLENIRRQCVLAARGPVPRGIGGALPGGFSGGEYQIRQWHQIPCRYQRGPSFLLTKEEVGGLKEFLVRLPERAADGQDSLIGWFVSHPSRSAGGDGTQRREAAAADQAHHSFLHPSERPFSSGDAHRCAAPARQNVLRITEEPGTFEHRLTQDALRAGSLLHRTSASALEVEMRAELPDGRVLSEKVLYGQ